jgi:outer membrane lipoprotein-sorting protein
VAEREKLGLSALLFATLTAACATPPPASQFPNAQAALDRMRATVACSRGLTSEAKIDYFGAAGRIRGNLLYVVSVPDKLRLDVVSPFGATVSTVTSDGHEFALFDLRQKQFLYGPANACNLGRFTHVPLPPAALVELLRGEAPVLVHQPGAATIAWEDGEYVVRIQSTRDATEEIHLAPVPADFALSYDAQRLRVTEVRVAQQGIELYRAELVGHRPAKMSAPRVDPDGLDPPVPPSGPSCQAEVPGRLHFLVPEGNQDVILENIDVSQNPPLSANLFRQSPPGGVSVRYSSCSD